MSAAARVWVIVPAAGSGTRFGGASKQYRPLLGRPVLWHVLHRLASAPGIAGLAVGIASGDEDWAHLADRPAGTYAYEGGATRAETVLAGIHSLPRAQPEDYVLVHDAARPCIARSDLAKLCAADRSQGALLASPVTDTLKEARAGRAYRTQPREHLWKALTPQIFPLEPLRQALIQAAAAGTVVTDEASACEPQGLKPVLVAGRADNIKLTWPEDLELAEAILRRLEARND